MYKVGDIAFDEYYVKSVELELDTCDVIIKVIFIKDTIEREKHYKIESNCNVDINELIKNLGDILKDE
jgi:hypothetical protein